jgi:hypothetical protein
MLFQLVACSDHELCAGSGKRHVLRQGVGVGVGRSLHGGAVACIYIDRRAALPPPTQPDRSISNFDGAKKKKAQRPTAAHESPARRGTTLVLFKVSYPASCMITN